LEKTGESGIHRAIEMSKTLFSKPYKIKKLPTALQDLKKMQPKSIDEATLINFELIHQWRYRVAARNDDDPENIIGIKTMLDIAVKTPSTLSDLDEILGKKGRITKDLWLTRHTILRILNEKNDFIVRMDSVECHNCFHPGHVAIHCPFERNPNCLKKYMEQNPATKKKQNQRRRSNWLRNQAAKNNPDCL